MPLMDCQGLLMSTLMLGGSFVLDEELWTDNDRSQKYNQHISDQYFEIRIR